MQEILQRYEDLPGCIMNTGARRIFFVHGRSLEKFRDFRDCLDTLEGIELVDFTDFTPNPKLEGAEKAAGLAGSCGLILAVGGGSAIDTAKYARLKNPGLPFVAIPTTAGSGSEATRFAVLYKDGKKLSVTDDIMIPDAVVLDARFLKYLPEYHRKSSALDAFCHSLESFWSVNANDESRKYSSKALSEITAMLEGWPSTYDAGRMLMASYTAGKAINIAQTTAGHAMCYKITGLFGTAHGHSAAMCCRVLFGWLCKHSNLPLLRDIASSMSCSSPEEAAEKFSGIFSRMSLEIPRASWNDIEELSSSVNPERLKNFPVNLDHETITALYREILKVS